LAASPKLLALRAKLLQAVRQIFIEQGYLEVETPVRLPSIAPEIHIEALASDEWYLQTSPELCMKRLLAAGIPKIFQLCKCFRKNERGARHLPELTLLEWYHAGIDYCSLMDECERLIRSAAERIGIGCMLHWGGETISLADQWERITLSEAFHKYAHISLSAAITADRFEEILVEQVEPNLGVQTPVFVYDYPAKLGSLARLKKKNPALAERFELYIGGIELANGFSELTDEKEQRLRFENERTAIRERGREPGPVPEKFLADLKNMPEAAGIALGFDRLVMLFSGCESIDEVVAFTPEEL
jgi:lysyl-tRNA synthetase class 2